MEARRTSRQPAVILAIATDDVIIGERIDLYRTRLREIRPELTGHDLKRMGIRPGPTFKDILSRLRDARLDGEIATRAEEERLVKRVISQQ